MKYLIGFILIPVTFLCAAQTNADTTLQKSDTLVKKDTTPTQIHKGNMVRVTEDYDGTEVIVGRTGGIMVQDKEDTVRVKIGRRGVRITETDHGTDVEILDLEDMEREFWFKPKRRFRGHWAGFELGMNNYLNSAGRLPNDYLSLNTGASWNVNINFIQYSLNLFHESTGLVTGLGLQMNDYKFSGNNSIYKDTDGNIQELPFAQDLQMSKLHVDYLTLPLIIEFHLNPDRYGRRLYLGVGMIGAMKIRSYTKVRYYDQGNKVKGKEWDDYSISPLQYAVTLRAGYKFIKVFANYNLKSLFRSGTAPEDLYPFSVGLVLLSF
jgi:hypothetical protein